MTDIAVPTVLRITSAELDAASPADGVHGRYRAVLDGPAGSGTRRVVTIAGRSEPHDLIVVDYASSPGYSRAWLRGAAVEDGTRPGTTRAEQSELREARKRIKLLEQENEVLRRAAAYLSQANLPGKGSTRS